MTSKLPRLADMKKKMPSTGSKPSTGDSEKDNNSRLPRIQSMPPNYRMPDVGQTPPNFQNKLSDADKSTMNETFTIRRGMPPLIDSIPKDSKNTRPETQRSQSFEKKPPVNRSTSFDGQKTNANTTEGQNERSSLPSTSKVEDGRQYSGGNSKPRCRPWSDKLPRLSNHQKTGGGHVLTHSMCQSHFELQKFKDTMGHT